MKHSQTSLRYPTLRTIGRSLGALSVAGMLALAAGCAPVGSGSSNGPQGGGTSAGGSGSQEPASAPTIAAVDPATVGGVDSVTLDAPDEGVKAQTFRFQSARNLSTAVDVVRGRMLRQASWDKSTATKIDSEVTAAGADVVGVQLTSTTSVGGADRTVPAAVWYDSVTGQSYSSPALIDPQGWATFASAVKTAAQGAGVDVGGLDKAMADEAAPYGTGPAIGFATDGAAVVSFGSGALGDHEVSVAVPADTVKPLLSEFGTRAAAAAASPTALAATTTATADPTLKATGDRPSVKIGPDCLKLKCVALTFDDGPGPRTKEVQDALAAGKAGGTFFLLGQNSDSSPETVLRGSAMGMEIANHSMTHPDLAKKSADRVTKEIVGTDEILKKITGETPLLMRPPYGSHNKTVDGIAATNGLAIVQWSVDTLDWKTRSTPSTIAAATNLADYNLPIVLMHDIHDSTVDAVPDIVSELTEAGYTLVTVSEQSLNQGAMVAGHAYCHGTGVDQAGFNCKG